MLKRLVIGAAALALLAPASGAMAQDFDYYFGNAQADQHDRFHDQEGEAHADAHARGFSSPEEHQAWHEAAREGHDAYHDDHPWTGYSGYGGGYYGYPGYYENQGYYGDRSYGRRRYYHHSRTYYRPYGGSGWSIQLFGGY